MAPRPQAYADGLWAAGHSVGILPRHALNGPACVHPGRAWPVKVNEGSETDGLNERSMRTVAAADAVRTGSPSDSEALSESQSPSFFFFSNCRILLYMYYSCTVVPVSYRYHTCSRDPYYGSSNFVCARARAVVHPTKGEL